MRYLQCKDFLKVCSDSNSSFPNAWCASVPRPSPMTGRWISRPESSDRCGSTLGSLGSLVWGLAFGLQIGILHYAWQRMKPSRQSAAVFFVLIFIVALPLNTGSYDFTFSVDIILAVVVLMLTARLKRRADSPAWEQVNPRQL